MLSLQIACKYEKDYLKINNDFSNFGDITDRAIDAVAWYEGKKL